MDLSVNIASLIMRDGCNARLEMVALHGLKWLHCTVRDGCTARLEMVALHG